MKTFAVAISLTATLLSTAYAADPIPAAPNGIELPADYADWRLISISSRTDNNTMRAILGNDVAIAAARAGNTNPWPDGAVLAKVVWKQAAEEHWPAALAPDAFVHVEFMFKDAAKWSDNGTGWGWARWVGPEHRPFGADASFEQSCIGCHTPVKGRDWVFTTPARFPLVSE